MASSPDPRATERALRERTRELAQRTRELEQRTQELEAVFRALPDLYFRMDADGTILDYKAGRQFGLYVPPEDFLGRPVSAVLPPSVSEKTAEALETTLRTGEVVGFEYELPLGEERRDFEARLLPLDGGQVVTVVRDVTERKAAEEALRTSEESYRGLFDNLSELVYVQDLDGRFLAVNEAALRAYGYTRDELIGRTPEMLAAPGRTDLDHVRELVARVLAGEPQRFEWWGQRKDGTVFPEELSARRSTYFGQDVVITVGRDVTERLEADAALRAREEHFRSLIENALDLIQVVSPTAGIAYTSPSVERLLGYTPDEILGASTMGFVHPDDQAHVQREIAELMAQPGVSRATEYRVLHRDGRWRTLEARGRTLSPTDPEVGLVVNARDVTERVEAEEALRRSEEHFRRLTDNASDMIQVVDAEARIVYTGPSVERLLGYTPDEIAGRSAFDYLHPDDVPNAMASLGELAAAPGTSLTVGYRVRHKDGRWRHFEANCRTLSPTSTDEGFVVNARDMTERVEAEEALRRAQDRIVQQEKLAGLGRMAAGIAHEIKNPLNFVTNFADLSVGLAEELEGVLAAEPERPTGETLAGAADLLADLTTNAHKIAEHGRRADAIVQGMMAHARAQPGERQRVDVNDLVETHASLAAEGWRAKHADVDVATILRLGDETGQIEGVPQELGRVVVNLVTNAFDAVAERARQDGLAYEPRVTVSTRRLGAAVEVVVEDNGRGVPEAVRERLFEPFFTTKPTGEGNVGLGLSLSRDVVVEGHEGSLEVESREGEGTVFTVTLPALP